MACTLHIDDYGSINSWENCVRVALESVGEISITYNNGSNNDSYFYSKGYVYYNGSEINEGWSWRDDDTTSEITITISDKIEKPSNPSNPDTPTNPSTPSTATIRYFFKDSGDPADYTTGYVGGDSYTKTIDHYGLSLVAGSTTTKTLTYYTDSEQSETGTYSITSPKSGYLLYSVVSSPELDKYEEYKKADYDIKAYCFKAPTITVAYTSTPDTLFGNPPATIYVQPNAYGSVGSFIADWGMIGGMTVTTNFRLNTGYKFLNWTVKKGNTTETKTDNKYRYTVDTFDNVTITANFERLPAVTLHVNPSETGTVNPSAGVKTPTGNDYKIKLTASPYDDYLFKNWTKNNTVISELQEYTYTGVKGEDSTITANFELIPIQDIDPSTPPIPSGYDNKIITNKEIQQLSLYTFDLNGQSSDKCPTYEHIINTNYNYSIVGVKDNNNYSNEQCVKYSDIVIGGMIVKVIIITSTNIKTPRIYLGTKNNNNNVYYSQLDDAYVNKDYITSDKTYQISINCLDWNSDSAYNKLMIKVDGHGIWGGNGRHIWVKINNTEYGYVDDEQVFTKEIETINLNTFLRNRYDITILVRA